MPQNKRLRTLQKLARRYSRCFEIGVTGSGHYRVTLYGPAGKRSVIVSATPSDQGAKRQVEKDLKKAAIELELR